MFVIIAEISVFVTMMFNFSITFIEGRTCVVDINMRQSLFELFFSIFVINFKIFFVHGQLFFFFEMNMGSYFVVTGLAHMVSLRYTGVLSFTCLAP